MPHTDIRCESGALYSVVPLILALGFPGCLSPSSWGWYLLRSRRLGLDRRVYPGVESAPTQSCATRGLPHCSPSHYPFPGLALVSSSGSSVRGGSSSMAITAPVCSRAPPAGLAPVYGSRGGYPPLAALRWAATRRASFGMRGHDDTHCWGSLHSVHPAGSPGPGGRVAAGP